MVNAGTCPVVVDFFATWCGPCNNIAPTFEALSGLYTNLKFAKVDVEKCRETAGKFKVNSMPTFIVIINGARMEQLVGADKTALETMVKKWSDQCPSQMDCPVPGQYDLLGFVDKGQLECLNSVERYPFHAMLEGRGVIVSDCDEQLSINFKFHQPVKVHSLWVKGPGDKAPKTVKLFINNPVPLNFDRALTGQAVQTLEFAKEEAATTVGSAGRGEADGSTNPYLRQLNFVRFQNVKSLQLFIVDNHGGGEQTVVEELKIYGTPLAATNMQEFKRVAGKAGEMDH